MEELLKLLRLSGLANSEDLRERLLQAFREAYSEGHSDGQNAADVGDEAECPKDFDVAWARSQTQRQLLAGLR